MSAAALRSGPRPLRFDLSLFPDVFDPHPVPRTLGWNPIVTRLRHFPERPDVTDKRRLPCWAPVLFREGAQALAATVVAVHLLVLDVDGGVAIHEALDRCRPFTVLAHTTWSHEQDTPRFRLVLPLARPVPADRWPAAWRAAVQAFGLPVDPSCSNANRRFLLPAAPDAGSPRAAVVRTRDVALDLLPMLPAPEAHAHGRAPLRLLHVSHDDVVRITRHRDVEPDARREIADALGAEIRGEGVGERAEGLSCPGCGRPTVWFFVAPDRATRARCKHKNSCGWTGALSDLVRRAA